MASASSRAAGSEPVPCKTIPPPAHLFAIRGEFMCQALGHITDQTTQDLIGGARGTGPATQLSPVELQRQWDFLAGDNSTTAYQALRILAANPRQAVALLREQLRPASAADPAHLARLIRNLDSGRFTVREQAAKELG